MIIEVGRSCRFQNHVDFGHILTSNPNLGSLNIIVRKHNSISIKYEEDALPGMIRLLSYVKPVFSPQTLVQYS